MSEVNQSAKQPSSRVENEYLPPIQLQQQAEKAMLSTLRIGSDAIKTTSNFSAFCNSRKNTSVPRTRGAETQMASPAITKFALPRGLQGYKKSMDKVIQSHMSLNTSDDDKEAQSLKQNNMNSKNGSNSKSMVDLNQGL